MLSRYTLKRTLAVGAAVMAALTSVMAAPQSPKFRHVASKMQQSVDSIARVRRIMEKEAGQTEKRFDTVRTVQAILDDLVPSTPPVYVNQARLPWIFQGYRKVKNTNLFAPFSIAYTGSPIHVANRIVMEDKPLLLWGALSASNVVAEDSICPLEPDEELEITEDYYSPAEFAQMRRWLTDAIAASEHQADLIYTYMVENPSAIDYTIWELPIPKRLKDDDHSAQAYIKSQPKVDFDQNSAEFVEMAKRRILWLHKVNGAVQFSQAYLSPNWYQGGNNHLSLLVSALWSVQLNQVYYPKVLLSNSISYKLGLNSTPGDKFHKYSVSEDLFQWNFQFGYKAWSKWFYSFTAQLKTQMLNNYGADSEVRKASFMSPGDLTLGLGMTYNTVNAKKTFSLNASISPISYNLKTCIDSKVNGTKLGIEVGHKSTSQIGSSAEVKMEWKVLSNITYNTRLFLFSDYSYFLGDWQNTISFAVNRFLSTQIYLHLRYDSSEGTRKEKWNHWMFKEILSFGLSYTFSSK